MEVDHLRKFFTLVVLRYCGERVNLNKLRIVAFDEVTDLILCLYAWRGVGEHCQSRETACRCGFGGRLNILFMLEAGIADKCTEIEPTHGKFHSISPNNFICAKVLVTNFND